LLIYLFLWPQLASVLTNLAASVTFMERSKTEEANMQAYCVKCRTKREMKDPKAVTLKNKKPATQGSCPTCGTKMFVIGKS